MTDAIWEKTRLMLVETPGMIAPAATATKPAIRAYSIKSWPVVSIQSFGPINKFVIRGILVQMIKPND
jgi:hypothetical protein